MLPKNYIFQNCLLKISFSKKTHFENCYLKKYIFKIALSKNINLIATIYSLPESSEKYLKNVVSNSIVHVIKNVNFQVYRVHPDGFIEKT